MSEPVTVTTNRGVAMPRLVYGTAWKKDETSALVAQALATGFRGIDTACQPKHYDEAGVGAGIRVALARGLTREDLYVQTKFTPLGGHDPKRIPYDPDAAPAAQVAQSFATSRANLGVEVLDALVLHSPVRERETWRALEAIVDSGGARELGISNCYALAKLEALCDSVRIAPGIVQNRFYAETDYDQAIRAYCRHRGIVYQSFWTLTANPQVLEHRVVRTLADRHGRTPAQILFRWLTQIGVVPLTGTRSAVHLREDLAIFEFVLEPPELDSLEALIAV